MRTKVQRWGNSLAVRIPRHLAVESRIRRGTDVEVSVRDGTLVVVPVRDRAYTLDELLLGVTKKNLHGETQTGRSIGREAW